MLLVLDHWLDTSSSASSSSLWHQLWEYKDCDDGVRAVVSSVSKEVHIIVVEHLAIIHRCAVYGRRRPLLVLAPINTISRQLKSEFVRDTACALKWSIREDWPKQSRPWEGARIPTQLHSLHVGQAGKQEMSSGHGDT